MFMNFFVATCMFRVSVPIQGRVCTLRTLPSLDALR